jgi:hypothetical protein
MYHAATDVCVLADHRGDFPPAVDFAQPDLPARHKAEEQHDGRVFARQRALRFGNLGAQKSDSQ